MEDVAEFQRRLLDEALGFRVEDGVLAFVSTSAVPEGRPATYPEQAMYALLLTNQGDWGADPGTVGTPIPYV